MSNSKLVQAATNAYQGSAEEQTKEEQVQAKFARKAGSDCTKVLEAMVFGDASGHKADKVSEAVERLKAVAPEACTRIFEEGAKASKSKSKGGNETQQSAS